MKELSDEFMTAMVDLVAISSDMCLGCLLEEVVCCYQAIHEDDEEDEEICI